MAHIFKSLDKAYGLFFIINIYNPPLYDKDIFVITKLYNCLHIVMIIPFMFTDNYYQRMSCC